MKNTKRATKSTKSTVNFAVRAQRIAASRARNAKRGYSEREARAIARADRAFLQSVAGL